MIIITMVVLQHDGHFVVFLLLLLLLLLILLVLLLCGTITIEYSHHFSSCSHSHFFNFLLFLVYIAIPLYFAVLCIITLFSYRRAKRLEKNQDNDKSKLSSSYYYYQLVSTQPVSLFFFVFLTK